MKYVKKIVSIIVTIILLVILSFNIFNYVSINVLKNELPTINGYAVLEVVSGSMEPKIYKGDIIIIDTKVKEYKVKDIVTFKDVNDTFVTHRIVKITEDGYITKGDNNNTIDEMIEKKSVVGKYMYKLNGLGAIMKSLRSPFNLVMIFISGILLCVLISTDSKGNPILDDEQKEYFEFLEYKKENDKKSRKNKQDNKIIDDKNLDKEEKDKKKENNKTCKNTKKSNDIKNSKNNKNTKNNKNSKNSKSIKASNGTKNSKSTKLNKNIKLAKNDNKSKNNVSKKANNKK